jgi:hypothetical protein
MRKVVVKVVIGIISHYSLMIHDTGDTHYREYRPPLGYRDYPFLIHALVTQDLTKKLLMASFIAELLCNPLWD